MRLCLSLCAAVGVFSAVLTASPAQAAAPAAGSKIEVREGDTWSTATFVRKEGRKTLVRYEDGTEEWVTSDRLRGDAAAAGAPAGAPGSTPARSAPSRTRDNRDATTAADLTSYTPLDLADAPEPVAKLGPIKPIVPAIRPGDLFYVPLHRKFESNGNSVDRLVACLDQPNIVVVSCGTVFADKPEVMCVDLVTRHQIKDAVLTARAQAVISAASEGKVLFTAVGMGWDPQVHHWELDGETYRLVANYNPFDNQSAFGKGLAAARLLGADRAIFAATSGQAYLVDMKTRKAIGCVRGSARSKPFIHPSGQLMAVITPQGTVQIIRLPEFTLAAELQGAATQGNISIDPTGACAAYPDDEGALRVVRISDGSRLGSLRFPNKQAQFSLIDSSSIFMDNNTVVDVKTGMPIWIYSRAAPSGDPMQLLASGAMGMLMNGDGGPVVCSAMLPDLQARSAAKSLGKDSFAVGPGMDVYISGDLSGFGKEKEQALRLIQDKLTAVNLKPVEDSKASLRLEVQLGQLPAEDRPFRDNGPAGVRVVKCPRTVLTLTLIAGGGTAVWEQSYTFTAGRTVELQEGQTLPQAVEAAALPRAGALNVFNPPGYLPKGAVIGSPAALGSSDITMQGIIAKPKPQPRPTPPAKTPYKRDNSKNANDLT